jgi:hypothetical protein
MQFQLPRLKQRSLNTDTVKKPVVDRGNRKFHRKCDPLLPSECCHSNLPFTVNQNDVDELEKLMQAEVTKNANMIVLYDCSFK